MFAPVLLQGSLSFMEDSGLSQPLTPSKPLAPAVEVTSVSFVPFNTELVFSVPVGYPGKTGSVDDML